MATHSMRIKKGDLVQVISGRSQKNGGDRGKQGKVIAAYPKLDRVLDGQDPFDETTMLDEDPEEAPVEEREKVSV